MVTLNLRFAEGPHNSKTGGLCIDGLIPVCAYCKRVREAGRPASDRDAWHEPGDFIALRAGHDFTHGICPDCYDRQMEIMDREDAAGRVRPVNTGPINERRQACSDTVFTGQGGR